MKISTYWEPSDSEYPSKTQGPIHLILGMCLENSNTIIRTEEKHNVFIKSKTGGKPWSLGKKSHKITTENSAKKMRMRSAKNRGILMNNLRFIKSLEHAQACGSEPPVGRKGAKLNLHYQDGGYQDQEMKFHLNHCTDGCKTTYSDEDIKSVQWLSRADYNRLTNVAVDDFNQLLGQNVLYIKFVDETRAEIAGQHYFCSPENDGLCQVFGNLHCHRCNQWPHYQCKVCGFMTDTVVYYFSREKYFE